MSNFRTKLLGLAALATAFAGMSYGQSIAGCVFGTATVNPSLRAEGETELVADMQATACADTGSPTGSVYASYSLPVTSKLESGNNEGGTALLGNSDAVLAVICTAVCVGTTYYPGTVSGTVITFSSVNFAPTAGSTVTLQVSNARVNASAGTAPQVTGNMIIQYTNASNVSVNVTNATPLNVGYILQSLGYSLALGSNNLPVYYGAATSSIATCTGYPLSSTTAPTAAFTLLIKELTGNAFKLQSGAGSEQGSFVSSSTATLAATTGTATQPTELQVTLGNIPSAATVYLPVSVTSGGTTLSLQGSVTALTSPTSLVGLATTGVFGFTPTSGTITAVYVTTADTTTGTTFSLPVYLTVAANAAPVQTTAMTANVTYIPQAAITGPTATIPTFAVSTAAPTNTLTVTPCNTTLLFPYVTNAVGFETGIAIANTTTDNLGKAGASSASPTAGTCTVNFYGGLATQPAAFTTPTIGATTTAAPTVTPVYASTLTTMSGATNFSGYAIASCGFLDAHGFAYIVDNFGTPSGTAEGYLALVVPNSRTAADGAVAH